VTTMPPDKKALLAKRLHSAVERAPAYETEAMT
jgi:hypothetical protein